MFALRAEKIGVRMTSKPALKSPELFGDRYPPSSDQTSRMP
jgi:hypothetical protein